MKKPACYTSGLFEIDPAASYFPTPERCKTSAAKGTLSGLQLIIPHRQRIEASSDQTHPQATDLKRVRFKLDLPTAVDQTVCLFTKSKTALEMGLLTTGIT
jgi:hypothetical protein